MTATILHWLGFGLCHQIPGRSFFGGGLQLPVCARDTGIYVGFVASFVIISLLGRGERRSELPRLPFLLVGGFFLGAMAWDGITSYVGLRSTTNDLRLATGLLAGWALPLAVAPLLNSSLWASSGSGRVLDGWKDAAGWLLPLPVVFAAVRWGLPLTGAAYPVFVALCIVATFVSVNLIVASLVPALERRAARLVDIWPACLLALAISAVEVGASAGVRMLLQSWTGLR